MLIRDNNNEVFTKFCLISETECGLQFRASHIHVSRSSVANFQNLDNLELKRGEPTFNQICHFSLFPVM